jgi:zinc transport system substrate-binding protein
MVRRLFWLSFSALCVVALCVVGSGCQPKPVARLKVAVTLFPIYDLARRIAGPDADVVLIVPPGTSEIDFVPAESEKAKVAGTKLGILVGLGLDEWMQELLDAAAPKARRLSVGDRVPTLVYRRNTIAMAMSKQGMPEIDPHLEGKPDPHVWLDPSRAALIGKAIAEEMSKADAPHALAYRQRASELETDLEHLDREVEWRVQNWGMRGFVSFRPAFAYFAERYHLEVLATLETYPGVVPPMHYDQEVLRLIRAKGVAGVFREPQFLPKPATIVAGAASIPVGVLDAVGGSAETDTYDKLIRFNTDALEKVLKAPPRLPSPEGGTAEDGGDAGSGG